jgi:hypothetical protein
MTISRAETGFNERDLLIAICIGLGMTAEAAAEAVGVDRSTVFRRKEGNKDFVEFWSAKVKTLSASSLSLETEKIKAKYERMYLKAIENLDDFLDDEDSRTRFQATVRMLDQREGKPVQQIRQQIETHHVEERRISLPEGAMQELIGLIAGSRALLVEKKPALLNGDTIEAQLVE